MQKSSVIAGVGVFVTLSLLAGVDYWYKERRNPMHQEQVIEEPAVPVTADPTVSEPNTTMPASEGAMTSSATTEMPVQPDTMSSSSAPRVVKKGTSTKKRTSVNVEDVLSLLQLTSQETTEFSLLQLIDKTSDVKTVVLLRDNDRAFLFSWVESDDVKTIFSGIKKALQEQFSGLVTNLVDETKNSPSGTPMDVLSFTDPAISKEAILFLRIRNRLYEFHIAKNGEPVLERFIEELGK